MFGISDVFSSLSVRNIIANIKSHVHKKKKKIWTEKIFSIEISQEQIYNKSNLLYNRVNKNIREHKKYDGEKCFYFLWPSRKILMDINIRFKKWRSESLLLVTENWLNPSSLISLCVSYEIFELIILPARFYITLMNQEPQCLTEPFDNVTNSSVFFELKCLKCMIEIAVLSLHFNLHWLTGFHLLSCISRSS